MQQCSLFYKAGNLSTDICLRREDSKVKTQLWCDGVLY